MNAQPELPLLVIVGPTASGKSTLGVWLAERLGGEVIACDSTQLYRGFDIGTAKPTCAGTARRATSPAGCLDGNEESTAGGYRERAIVVLDGSSSTRKDFRFSPWEQDFTCALCWKAWRTYRSALRNCENDCGRARKSMGRTICTASCDGWIRESAEKIAPADEQKLIRAIEVCLLTKKPLSEVHRSGRKPLERLARV